MYYAHNLFIQTTDYLLCKHFIIGATAFSTHRYFILYFVYIICMYLYSLLYIRCNNISAIDIY